MPLTQARMLAVIREAEATRDAFERLKSHLEDALALERTLAQAPEHITFIDSIKYILATNPRPNMERCAVEAYHFHKFKKRNETEKQRATQRRQRRGIPQSHPSNPTKFQPHHPKGAKPQADEYTFDEGPEITADSIFDTTTPDRDLLAQQLAADKALAQELLHDPEFRAITIPPKTTEGKGS